MPAPNGGSAPGTPQYNPSDLGRTLGNALQGYATQPAPVFGQSLHPGLSSTTQGGLNATLSASNAAAPGLTQAANWNSGLLSNNGYGAGQQQATNNLGAIAGQFGNMAANPLTSGQQGTIRTLGNLSNTWGDMAVNPLTSGQQGNVANAGNIASGFSAMASNPLSAGQTGALNTTNTIGGQFGQMAAGQTGPSLTESELMNVAQGGAFGMNDPGYAAMRDAISNDVMTDVSGLFNASGRFGGGSHVDRATRSLTSALAPMDYQNYQNDIARQERALGAIEGQRQLGFSNRAGALSAQLGAAGQQFGMGQQGFDNQAGALGAALGANQAGFGMDQQGTANAQAARAAQQGLAQSQFGMIQQGTDTRANALASQLGANQAQFGQQQQALANAGGAAAAAPGFYQAQLLPGQTQTAVGQIQDANAAATRQGEYDLWDRTQNADYNRLLQMIGTFTGTQQNAGMQEEVPWWQQALGAGAVASGIFGNIFNPISF